jgi:hypothetical protein
MNIKENSKKLIKIIIELGMTLILLLEIVEVQFTECKNKMQLP